MLSFAHALSSIFSQTPILFAAAENTVFAAENTAVDEQESLSWNFGGKHSHEVSSDKANQQR